MTSERREDPCYGKTVLAALSSLIDTLIIGANACYDWNDY